MLLGFPRLGGDKKELNLFICVLQGLGYRVSFKVVILPKRVVKYTFGVYFGIFILVNVPIYEILVNVVKAD